MSGKSSTPKVSYVEDHEGTEREKEKDEEGHLGGEKQDGLVLVVVWNLVVLPRTFDDASAFRSKNCAVEGGGFTAGFGVPVKSEKRMRKGKGIKHRGRTRRI